jgi:hypothetical protein
MVRRKAGDKEDEGVFMGNVRKNGQKTRVLTGFQNALVTETGRAYGN